MNVKRVRLELVAKYPGVDVVVNNNGGAMELVAEVEPTTKHVEYSVAIAVIDKSLPHYHRKSGEEYEIVRGNLILYIDGKRYEMGVGEKRVIEPGQVHWAEGKETWVKTTSYPGWTWEDHILTHEDTAA